MTDDTEKGAARTGASLYAASSTSQDGRWTVRNLGDGMTAQTSTPEDVMEDIIVWPDGTDWPTWCYREELEQMTHMGDDFEVVRFESPRWNALVAQA